MFNFLDMMGNHEDRKVDHFEKDELIVDTCFVSDADYNFETAVSHPEYNNGAWIIVQGYETKSEAQISHNNWIKVMTTEPLPDPLRDNGGSGINLLCDAFNGNDDWRNYPRQKKG